jgi:hypothetical protein
VVGSVLAWAATDGFSEVSDVFDGDWKSAGEFRARHATNAILRMMAG